MTPVTSRKWEVAVIGVILLIASYLLFVPPIVGVADQGDYRRLTARVGLAPPPGISYLDQVNCWVITHWNIVATQPLQYFSTAEFPVRTAILLHKIVTSATTLDIRWISGVYLALFLGLILAVLRNAHKLPAAAYFVIAAGLVLVCTDSGYISYFNSFLTESAALLGVFAFVAAGLWAVTAEDPSWLHMTALVLSAAFLAGSKAQNAVLGVFAACWIIWLFRRKPAQRYASMIAGLALVCFSGFVLTRAPLPESNLFNAIYDRVLPNSADPPATLAELGLKPETAVWQDKNYWDVTIESPDVYPRKVTRLTLLAFYLRHPSIDLQMARGALTLSNELDIGNFPRESGAPRSRRTEAFTGYDRLRARLSGIWLVFPLLAANIAAVLIWRRREAAGLISTLGTMAMVAFLIGAFYDTSPQKHLFTFNLLFDALVFADLSAAAVRMARIRVSLPIFGYLGRVLVALLLALTLGFALRLEVFPKGFLKSTFPVQNLAEGKPATQSSTLPGDSGAAFSAVDGNTDGNFLHDSVTATNSDPNAWWEVDLGTSTAVGSIVIWNRTDCCPSRLSDYWVFLSNTPFNPSDTPATLQNRAGIWKSHQTVAPNPSTTIAAPGVKGRYLRVQLTGTGYLSLAEVQVPALGSNLAAVSPSGTNLAVGKPATQSSTFPGYSTAAASAAVDGNLDGKFSRGSVTVTNQDPNAWWQVDLGTSSAIGSIVIWNRSDCCASRLSDYWVFVSDTPFNPSDTPATLQNRPGTWKGHQTNAPNPSTAIRTAGAKGRYVRVQLAGTDYLSLAEVQVFGQ